MKLVKALRTYGRKPICVKNWLLTARVLVGQEWVRGYSVTEDWYRFESDRRAEITVFTLEADQTAPPWQSVGLFADFGINRFAPAAIPA